MKSSGNQLKSGMHGSLNCGIVQSSCSLPSLLLPDSFSEYPLHPFSSMLSVLLLSPSLSIIFYYKDSRNILNILTKDLIPFTSPFYKWRWISMHRSEERRVGKE